MAKENENKKEFLVQCQDCGVLKQKESEHYCYIQPLAEKTKRPEQIRYVFFDIEATQNKKIRVNGIRV